MSVCVRRRPRSPVSVSRPTVHLGTHSLTVVFLPVAVAEFSFR